MKITLCLVALLMLPTACTPAMQPLLAHRKLERLALSGETNTARIGESMLSGLDMFAYPAYAPREAFILPEPKGVSLFPATPAQKWIAGYQLGDGSLIIEAPASISTQGIRLGLSIDQRGKVIGRRPWFDLTEKGKIATQPAWDGFRRLLFVPCRPFPVDIFSFDLRYAGMRDGRGAFDYLDMKHPRTNGQERKTVLLSEGEKIHIHGLTIMIQSLTPERVNYLAKKE